MTESKKFVVKTDTPIAGWGWIVGELLRVFPGERNHSGRPLYQVNVLWASEGTKEGGNIFINGSLKFFDKFELALESARTRALQKKQAVGA